MSNYQAKQKHFLPFHDTKLKQLCEDDIKKSCETLWNKLKVSTKVKDINIKTGHTTFSIIL